MGRGRDGRPTGNIDAARRKRSRRAAATRVMRAQKERLRATERKHVKRFLSPAVAIARRYARETACSVQIERTGGSAGWRQRWSWTEADLTLDPVGISVQFRLADKQGTGPSSLIHVRLGRQLVRPCPADLLQSGDRRAFAEWLDESLRIATERPGTASK